MQGNTVMLNVETGFTYGGVSQAKYAGSKLATGAENPAERGTLAGSSGSLPHLPK